jgi:hypothetical protein
MTPGSGSAQNDEPLAEIDDEVTQFGRQIATNWPFVAVP